MNSINNIVDVTNYVMLELGQPLHAFDAAQIRGSKLVITKSQPQEKFTTLDGTELVLAGDELMIKDSERSLRLADEDLQVNLAISLHSAVEAIRTSIMPVNNAYPLKKLMEAVRTYMRKTNRRVMFEYLLLEGKNDRYEDAVALAKLFGHDRRLVHVNLIKYHETEAFKGTDRPHRLAFLDWLHELGIPATHRITFGEDIDAACGQLAVKDAEGQTWQGLKAVHLLKKVT
jgi:hypothetical protein